MILSGPMIAMAQTMHSVLVTSSARLQLKELCIDLSGFSSLYTSLCIKLCMHSTSVLIWRCPCALMLSYLAGILYSVKIKESVILPCA